MNYSYLSSKHILRFIVLIFVIGYLFSDKSFAQLNYTDFPTTSAGQLTFLGDSGIEGTSLRLIRTQFGGSTAAVWSNNKHRVSDGFVAMFTFRIINAQGPVNGGADGLAFVVQNSSISSPMGIGGGGGNIGYGKDTNPKSPANGIMKSIAIEFDTYKNTELNDPDNNHISFHTNNAGENNANENSSLMSVSLGSNPNLRDGADHLVRIEYDGATAATPFQWRIYIDNLTTPRMTLTKDITMAIGAGETDAYVGFTAGSAFEWENHEISNWSFSPRFLNLPNFTAVDADTDGTQSVWTAEYHPGADANNFNVNATIDTAVLPDRKTELWAKYYFPNNLSSGPYPIIILHHGNHSTCGYIPDPNIPQRFDRGNYYTRRGECINAIDPDNPSHGINPLIAPSHKGYDYLATKLATHGYIVVSVNSNLGITGGDRYRQSLNPNFPEYTDDAFLILARGRLILRHLQKLSEWNQGVSSFATSTTSASATNTSQTGWFGTKIVVGASPITVRSIGRMYLNGNNGNHTLRIIRASDNVVVAETTISMTNWNHLQYKYQDLPSTATLAANSTYYLVSQEQANGDKFARASVTSNTIARIVGGVRSYNGLSWKNIGGNPYTFGIDILYESASSTPTELGVNLKGKIDFSNVGLMGHSRGGEGMRATYNLYRDVNSPWQTRILGPIATTNTMKTRGIFEFAPTDRFVLDNNLNLLRLLNADGTAWNVVLPACDGDVSWLAGTKPFDRMLEVTSESPATQKSTYFVYGANHNFYNTEWQRSDTQGSSLCIGPNNTSLFTSSGYGSIQQQKTGSSAFMAFFRANVGSSANASFNQNFNPSFNVPSTVSSVTKIDRGYTRSPSTTQTKEFNDLTNFAVGDNVCSLPTSLCSDSNLSILDIKGANVQFNPLTALFEHDDDFVTSSISWTTPSPKRYFQANWIGTGSSIDASEYQTLDFRVSRRRQDGNDVITQNSLNVSESTNMLIQLVMNNNSLSRPIGLSKYMVLDGPVGKPHFSSTDQDGSLHPVLRTVRIPLNDFLGADLTQVKGVRFIFSDTSKGAIFLANIRLSN